MSAVDKGIVGAAGATVVGLAGVAGAISYSHMAELARLHGEVGGRSHAFPVSVDGIEVVASLVLLAHRRAGSRAGCLARAARGPGPAGRGGGGRGGGGSLPPPGPQGGEGPPPHRTGPSVERDRSGAVGGRCPGGPGPAGRRWGAGEPAQPRRRAAVGRAPGSQRPSRPPAAPRERIRSRDRLPDRRSRGGGRRWGPWLKSSPVRDSPPSLP